MLFTWIFSFGIFHRLYWSSLSPDQEFLKDIYQNQSLVFILYNVVKTVYCKKKLSIVVMINAKSNWYFISLLSHTSHLCLSILPFISICIELICFVFFILDAAVFSIVNQFSVASLLWIYMYLHPSPLRNYASAILKKWTATITKNTSVKFHLQYFCSASLDFLCLLLSFVVINSRKVFIYV